MKSDTEGSAIHLEQQRLSSDDAPYNNIHLPAFLTSGNEESNAEVKNRVSVTVSTLVRPGHDAKAATAIEHAMSVREGLRLYPKAVFFSMLLSLALVMDGYDKSLLSAFFSLPEFRQRFGTRLDDGTYQISARWMAGLQNGSIVGEILGLIASGLIYERYGYKENDARSSNLDQLLYLWPILRAGPSNALGRRDTMRPFLGCFPNANDNLRCRSHSRMPSRIFDFIRQLMLGDGPIRRRRRGSRNDWAQKSLRLGLSDTIRGSVVLADTTHNWRYLRSRIALVPSEERED